MKCTSCDSDLSNALVSANVQDEEKGVIEVVVVCKECHSTYSKEVNFSDFDEN